MTDDPEYSARKEPLFKVELNSNAPLAGLIVLCVVLFQLLSAVETGHLFYSRYRSHSVVYQDHPWEFLIHFGILVLSIPLCVAVIWAYFLKRRAAK